ncbi:hypothetical protein K8I28_11060 [bacterium]|nr:hypothetical protein [bacterium]
MSRYWSVCFVFCLILIGINTTTYAYQFTGTGVNLHGDLALTFTTLDDNTGLNANNRGDNAFSVWRSRLFISKSWSPKISAIMEILLDENADPRLNGAYLVFMNFLGPWNAKVGFMGTNFGNFAYRSTYFKQNPVIGTPLMWNYHLGMTTDGNFSAESRITDRGRVGSGAVLTYDVCWDNGIEVFTDWKGLEASFAVTLASLSNPRAYSNEGYNKIARLGVQPVQGMRLGVSGSVAPWLNSPTDETSAESATRLNGHITEHYNQYATGYYYEHLFGHWEIYSEGMISVWETPQIEENLSAMSAYVDARWTFVPSWFLGARLDYLTTNEIEWMDDDGVTQNSRWAYPVSRYEVAIGKRIIREGIIRLNYQSTHFREDDFSGDLESIDILALQFHFVF